jgi:hypothetical protein
MTAESVQTLLALALGFAFAWPVQFRLSAVYKPLAPLQPAQRRARRVCVRRDPAVGRHSAVLDHAQHNPGLPARGPSLRIRFPGDADRRLLEPDVRPCPRDDLAGLRSPASLKTFLPRSVEASSRAWEV